MELDLSLALEIIRISAILIAVFRSGRSSMNRRSGPPKPQNVLSRLLRLALQLLTF